MSDETEKNRMYARERCSVEVSIVVAVTPYIRLGMKIKVAPNNFSEKKFSDYRNMLKDIIVRIYGDMVVSYNKDLFLTVFNSELKDLPKTIDEFMNCEITDPATYKLRLELMERTVIEFINKLDSEKLRPHDSVRIIQCFSYLSLKIPIKSTRASDLKDENTMRVRTDDIVLNKDYIHKLYYPREDVDIEETLNRR